MDYQSFTFSTDTFEGLAKEVAAGALFAKFCQVRYVGANLTSQRMVTVIDDQNMFYLSEWPEWAFQMAKEALLANHKLWIIADDAPFGNNIRQLYILNRDFPN